MADTMTPTPEDRAEQARLRGDPHGEPLAVILYRLQQIERRMDGLMTAELYVARHEALQARVRELEHQQDGANRSIRQVGVGLVVAVGTAVVTAGVTVF